MAFDFEVYDERVFGSDGATVVHTAADFTEALIWAVAHANTITYVPAGLYSPTASIWVAPGSKLYGYGDGVSGTEFTSTLLCSIGAYDPAGQTLEKFRVSGLVYTFAYAENDSGTVSFIDITSDNFLDKTTIGGAFWVYPSETKTIDGVTFTRCNALNSNTYGFLLGTGADPCANTTIKNVTFTDCTAVDCGRYDRQHDWIVGFNICEGVTNIQNVTLDGCIATGNYESGFHLEYAPIPLNINFIDCVATDNGTKPDNHVNDDATVGCQYGRGFFFDTADIPLVMCRGCTGTGNRLGLTTLDSQHTTTANFKVWADSAGGNLTTGTWLPAGEPAAGDDLILKAGNGAENTACNINVATVFNSIYTFTTYTANLTHTAQSIYYADLFHKGSNFVMSNTVYHYCTREFYRRDGSVMNGGLQLVMSGPYFTWNGSVTALKSVEFVNDCLVTAPTLAEAQNLITAAGKVVTIASGSTFQHNTAYTFTNLAEWAGTGTFRLNTSTTSATVDFSKITCALEINKTNSTGNKIITSGGHFHGISAKAISAHATATVTWDLAGYDIILSGAIDDSTRGIISSTGGSEIIAPGGISGAGTLDMTGISKITAPACTVATLIGSDTTDFEVPAGVAALAASAFAAVVAMKSVILPSGLATIGASCFSGDTQLLSLTFDGLVAPTSVGANWILNVPAGARGHAYSNSDFPAPDDAWNDLTMGTTIDTVTQFDPVTDSITVSESSIVTKRFASSESISISDQASIFKRFAPALDTLGSTDSATIVKKLPASDSIGIGESALITKSMPASDSISLSDQVKVSKYYAAAVDSLGLSDSATIVKRLPVSDSLGIADQGILNKRFGSVPESFGISDSAMITKRMLASDPINITESAAVSKRFGPVADSIGVSDSSSLTKRFAAAVDNFVLTEAARISKVFGAVIDTLNIQETAWIIKLFHFGGRVTGRLGKGRRMKGRM